MVVTHFKGNVSVVFQVVLGEYKIRVKGAREVNDPKREEKSLSEHKYFELQNLTKWFCNELFFFWYRACARDHYFNRVVQVTVGHSQTSPERDVNLHTLAPVDFCCTQAKNFYNVRPR